MALAGDAVIIEVGLNEGAGQGINPHVPIGPDDVAADALRCRDAGATVIHWHARDPQSADQRLGDTDLYAAALAPMQAAGLLGYPSYPVDGVPPRHRLDHVWALHEQVGMELAPIDLGSVTTVPAASRDGARPTHDSSGTPRVARIRAAASGIAGSTSWLTIRRASAAR